LANEAADKLKSSGVDAIAVRADASQKTEVGAAIAEIVRHFGSIDILVNNAGIHRMGKVTDIDEETWDKILNMNGSIDILVNNAGIHRMGKVTDIDEETWDKILNMNLKGDFLMIQAVVPYMQANNYGKVLNIASAAVYRALPDQLHYVASKGGIVSMTRALALELAPSKINVNAVCPGAVETPGNEKYLALFKEILIQRIPLGRVAWPSDIASAVLFLVSDEAEYITGQCLPVCGGVTIGMPV
jgi:3-oxoacyl-[acyl-carrier protein] reductase